MDNSEMRHSESFSSSEINEDVYLNEIFELQKEVERLKLHNAQLLSTLREYIKRELKRKRHGKENETHPL